MDDVFDHMYNVFCGGGMYGMVEFGVRLISSTVDLVTGMHGPSIW